MPEEKETREKLIRSAKKEFLEKGYMKASLRTICKNSGVTTGALYFFFENKEDLLSAIVEGPLQELNEVIQEHLSVELSINTESVFSGDTSEDMKSAKEIVHYLYQHYDVFQILLTKSQGSKYENIVDVFVDSFEQHYDRLAELIAQKEGVKKPDKYILHWVSHMQTDAFVHLLTHERDEEKAAQHIEQIVSYLVVGWPQLFLEK
ncbi:MAG: TetR/AcrR family transcriptional regulator [Roseburia sp.]